MIRVLGRKRQSRIANIVSSTRQVALPSKQWFPPTLGEYLQIGFLRGVW